MMIKIVEIGFKLIKNEELKLLKRGENAYDSGHDKKCVFLNNNLKGVINASMREQTYNVEVILKFLNC